MTGLRLRLAEGQDAPKNLLWDSFYDNEAGFADWLMAGPDETGNRGGLSALRHLPTAVILCLFTDRRCPDDHPLRKWVTDNDPRGWWGDGLDIDASRFERPLGSLLWLLQTAALADPVALGGMSVTGWAELFAREALQVLADQGAVARIDVSAAASGHRLSLTIRLYATDGSVAYDRRFEDLWNTL